MDTKVDLVGKKIKHITWNRSYLLVYDCEQQDGMLALNGTMDNGTPRNYLFKQDEVVVVE